MGMRILLLSCFLFSEVVIANILPQLPWERVNISIDGRRVFVKGEKDFFKKTVDKKFICVKLDTWREFDCPIDAAFWLFNPVLTTNSHFGDTEYKKTLKSWLTLQKK